MKIKQHRPAFVETGTERETTEFSTQEELLAIPWVKNFADQPDFHTFSIDPASEKFPECFPAMLMAEYKNGLVWYVVGYLDSTEGLTTLPKWEAKYAKTEV